MKKNAGAFFAIIIISILFCLISTTCKAGSSTKKGKVVKAVLTSDNFVKSSRNSDTEELSLCLSGGIGINSKSLDGKTALIWAIQGKNFKNAEFLIKKGADVNLMDTQGMTPLICAIMCDQNDTAKMLIDNGANVNLKSADGCAPLALAIAKKNLRMARYLIEKSADINIKNADNESLLMWAVKFNDLPLSKFLIDCKLNINHIDGFGKSALSMAVYYQNPEIVKFLIEKGADINIKIGNMNLIEYAEYKGDKDIASIIKNKIDSAKISSSLPIKKENVKNSEKPK